MPIWNFHLKLRSKHGADLKLQSKHNEKNADPSTARGTPIQARREERQSKHTDPPQVPIWNSDPSTARRTPIQARREELRSKHNKKSADPPQAPIYSSLSLLVCPCVGVFGFVVSMGDFVVDFWLSVGVCVSEEAALVVQMEKREKKKERN